VSLKRINVFLQKPEVKQYIEHADEIRFANASIAFPSPDENALDQERFVLRGLDFACPTGELTVISGKTGTGKSLLLLSVLGEADLISGAVHAPRRERYSEQSYASSLPPNASPWLRPAVTAYVNQSPWIENGTLRDNILFGLPLDEERYEKTLRACALPRDLDLMPDGDLTELGVQGVNLSGGQRWRIALARAIYSRASILVLDDIFSAVDVHVGRHILERCLVGELCAGRTRVLVTHHVAMVQSKAALIVELGDGTVRNCGTPAELGMTGALAEIVRREEKAEAEAEADHGKVVDRNDADPDGGSDDGHDTGPLITRARNEGKKAPRQYITKEERSKGSISWHVWSTYLAHAGRWYMWVAAIVLYFSTQITLVCQSYVLRRWSDGEHTGGGTIGEPVPPSEDASEYLRRSLEQQQQPMAGDGAVAAQEQNGHSLAFWLFLYVATTVLFQFFNAVRFYLTVSAFSLTIPCGPYRTCLFLPPILTPPDSSTSASAPAARSSTASRRPSCARPCAGWTRSRPAASSTGSRPTLRRRTTRSQTFSAAGSCSSFGWAGCSSRP
jgi:ABC-type sulfate/molybdate transport systems ATPase subunit